MFEDMSINTKYAILFSGFSAKRHIYDLELIYRTLIDYYNYKESNIFVLANEELIKNKTWKGDETPFRIKITDKSTKKDLKNILLLLAKKINKNDTLFIHTNGHGINYFLNSAFLTCRLEILSANYFAKMLNNLPEFKNLIVIMQQCFSGGFGKHIIKNAKAKNIFFCSAASEFSLSRGTEFFNHFTLDFFSYLIGSYPPKIPIDKNNFYFTERGFLKKSDIINNKMYENYPLLKKAFLYASSLSKKDKPLIIESPKDCSNQINVI
ncbi:MAG: hypothetical protein A2Y34_01150 [Spirochaetes bacterium GWC1_27_15]|nr:MAG: hypothetical protein A2Z98_00950 [Spirochaetes bacterium GWB1_27_13]OHD24056.1 MAG: hypothetical protein A2Y34_01150 [Spirochaetes bacterium GWC1_27_15]